MKKLFSLILVGMLAVSGLSAKVKLSVLYVGGTANMDPILMSPGSVDSVALAASVKERMAHFTKFLKKNFTNVKSIEGKDYTPEMSAAYGKKGSHNPFHRAALDGVVSGQFGYKILSCKDTGNQAGCGAAVSYI